MSFCNLCRDFLNLESHHATFSALEDSARTCEMCKIIMKSLLSDSKIKRAILESASHPNGYTKLSVRKVFPPESGCHDETTGFYVSEFCIATRAHTLWCPTFVMCNPENRYYDRAVWSKKTPVTFDDSFPVLRGWLQECDSGHDLCDPPTTQGPRQLPSRLLRVDGTLQLVEGVGRECTYAALSHCWGSSSDVLRTTRDPDTLSRHQQSISMSELPLNFKDAVKITRMLGLDYLWIDSLCIVQDDKAEWESESEIMADIYSNAHITIAATASKDSHGGFLFERKPAIQLTKHPRTPNEATYHLRLPSGEAESLYASPLYSRGWVLQEMVLSRRVVHFAHDQLLWHCRSRMVSEDGFLDAAHGSTFFILSSPAVARHSWWTWAEDYSSRQLTNPGDKFAALAGLTTAFHEKTALTPVAGLWKEDLYFGLLWCVKTNKPWRTTMPARNLGIPTWSWMSVNRPISSMVPHDSLRWEDQDRYTEKRAEILDVSMDWSGFVVRGGRLHMRARLKQAHVCAYYQNEYTAAFNVDLKDFHLVNNFTTLYLLYQKAGPLCRAGMPPSIPCIGYCAFDSEPPPSGSRVLCLELSIHGPCYSGNDGSTADVLCQGCLHCYTDLLIVQAVEESPNEFRRLGVGTMHVNLGTNKLIHPHSDFFKYEPSQDIVLG